MTYPFAPALLPISIHAPREGGDLHTSLSSVYFFISIHAPREGGDGTCLIFYKFGKGISIHAPREGGDRMCSPPVTRRQQFQSTPPARGATNVKYAATHQFGISIHAPREGGDSKDAQFYPRIFDK